MITQESRFLLRMFDHYRRNVLPTAGGILDQSHYYAEAMEIAALHQNEIDRETAERKSKAVSREQYHTLKEFAN